MKIEEADVLAVCLGIFCNFTRVCGEEKARETENIVRELYREYKRMADDLALIERSLERSPHNGLVTCKECRYKSDAKVNKKGFLICPASGMEITDDDFCSYAERCDL